MPLINTGNGFSVIGPLGFEGPAVSVDGRDVAELIRTAHDRSEFENAGGEPRKYSYARLTLELMES